MGRSFLLGMAAITAASMLGNVALAIATFRSPPPPIELRVVDVSISPVPPRPGEVVTVQANVTGPASLVVRYAFFSFGGVGLRGFGGTMQGGIGGAYTATIGPFEVGTEVWVAVAAATPRQGPTPPTSLVFPIGSLPRGTGSGLAVAQVEQIPPDPLLGNPVTIQARVTSAANVTAVAVHVLAFGRTCSEAFEQAMTPFGPPTYTASVRVPLICPFGELVAAYRVIAVDATANTAVSDPRLFRPRIPEPVP